MSTNSLLEGKHHEERKKHHSIDDFIEDLEENTETIIKFLYKKIVTILFWMFLPITLPMVITQMFISDFLEVRKFCKKSLECATVFLEILTQVLEFFRDSKMPIEKKLERISELIQMFIWLFTFPMGMVKKLVDIIFKILIPHKKKAMLVTLKSYPPQKFSNLKIDDIHHLELSPSDCEVTDDDDSGLSSISRDGVPDGFHATQSNEDVNSSSTPVSEDPNIDKTTGMPSDPVPRTNDVQPENNSQPVIHEPKPILNERTNENNEPSKAAENELTATNNEYPVNSGTA